jgi:streptomycin 6-kinase
VSRTPFPVEVSAILRAKAAAAAGGEEWLRRLPDLLLDLKRVWSVTLTEPLSGGTASFVVRAVNDDGRLAVVKVAVPGSGLQQQVHTLARADGDGYVGVVDYAPEHDAVLLEALGPSLLDSDLPPTAQLSIMARLLKRAWRVQPSAAFGEPQNKAAGVAELVSGLWEELDHPCDRRVIDHALGCALRRSDAFNRNECVVVHGDAAAANAARVIQPRPGTEDGFVLLDPDGFIGDPIYDLGVALRDWCPQLLSTQTPASLLSDYCQVLASEASVDPAAVWDWAYLERVATGLYALSLRTADLGIAHLRSAEALIPDGGQPRNHGGQPRNHST